jgi:hypothetical protein
MLSKFDVARLVIPSIVGLSSGFTVRSVIANTASDPESLKEQAKLAVGALTIGGMVAAQARQYTDGWIDGIEETWNKFQEMRQEATKETETQAESPT